MNNALKILLLVTVSITLMIQSVFAEELPFNIVDGRYVGQNVETGGICSIKFSEDGEEASRMNVYYHVLTSNSIRGLYNYCYDSLEDKRYKNCAGGDQMSDTKYKQIFIYGFDKNSIQKIKFYQDSSSSTDDFTCINLKLEKE